MALSNSKNNRRKGTAQFLYTILLAGAIGAGLTGCGGGFGADLALVKISDNELNTARTKISAAQQQYGQSEKRPAYMPPSGKSSIFAAHHFAMQYFSNETKSLSPSGRQQIGNWMLAKKVERNIEYFDRARANQEWMPDPELSLQVVGAKLLPGIRKICEHLGSQHCAPKKFILVEKKGKNAFVDAKGAIHVHAGLMHALDEAELAAVLSHEAAHHIMRHIEKSAGDATTLGVIGMIIGGAMDMANAYYGNARPTAETSFTAHLGQLGAHIGSKAWGPDYEREADLLSAYILVHSPYKLQDAQQLWIKMIRDEEEVDADRDPLLPTHPSSVERVAAWERIIEIVGNDPDKLPELPKKPKPDFSSEPEENLP